MVKATGSLTGVSVSRQGAWGALARGAFVGVDRAGWFRHCQAVPRVPPGGLPRLRARVVFWLFFSARTRPFCGGPAGWGRGMLLGAARLGICARRNRGVNRWPPVGAIDRDQRNCACTGRVRRDSRRKGARTSDTSPATPEGLLPRQTHP